MTFGILYVRKPILNNYTLMVRVLKGKHKLLLGNTEKKKAQFI